ncbi:MAG: cobalt ECF transporter T component CbiQ [Desulfuromonadaceae bacterium]|nr:cobalt ECF transporter T component CbiQ [Desulfuromonadaceae bacterium]MDD2854332.1 cobalt ECF transporter T component CbiQ [Desulfuromonadaceae bacterium]
MASIHSAVLDLKRLDLLANGTSSIHRLDARAKVLVTVVFTLCIVSYNRYELNALFPFFIFPLAMISLGEIPLLFILRKIVLLCPFVLAVGIFNPVFDREIILQFGSLGISGGWISFASIMARSILTVGTAFILVGVTGFTAVCQALERLGMPQVFAVQLLFLYRYIFVLTEESGRASRAKELRSCGKKGEGIHSFSSMVGHLLIRTWSRAERIHTAMLARGFTGQFHTSRQSNFGRAEIIFVLGWITIFIFLRIQNVSLLLGSLVTRLMP